MNINQNSSRHTSYRNVNLLEKLYKRTDDLKLSDLKEKKYDLSKRDFLEGGEPEKKEKRKGSVESNKTREDKT